MQMKIEIKHRYTNAVIYTTEVADDDAHPIRTALQRGIAAGAYLADANLADANLTDANLTGANLAGANLTGAYLMGANLAGATERAFKADFWMTLTQNAHEVPALVAALRYGRVDGSTYEGACACLVGTIANARGVSHKDLDHSANNPAERWFMMIRKGDTPDNETGGGFAAKKALEWSLEWCALNGVAA